MLFFNRKKKEEPETLESKDVKVPRKKRKKVEPPKPLGKIERIIILFFLLLAPALSILLLAHSYSSKTAKRVSVPAPKLMSQVLSASTQLDTDALKTKIEAETKDLTGTYGIWIQALDGSYNLGINENETFDGASLFKLPMMINYYTGVDNGTVDPDTNYALKFSDAASGAGILASLPPGTVVTYQDMVNAMGKNSDNTAFSIMLTVLGIDAETNTITMLGMNNTDFNTSTTTPYDVGLLFYKLSNGNLISSSSKSKLIDSLTNTDYESLIPSSVPNYVKVAHKFGEDDGELNDAGIVYANKPYILVILTKDIDPVEASTEIPKLGTIVYNWAAGVQ